MNHSEFESKALIISGNAATHGNQNNGRGWFVGRFIDPAEGLRSTGDVEVKWGIHAPGEGKHIADASLGTTLTLLISGTFIVEFPDQNASVTLAQAGDYVIFAPGMLHAWRAITTSTVVTIRWPSV